jgi:hypothetical protein
MKNINVRRIVIEEVNGVVNCGVRILHFDPLSLNVTIKNTYKY